MVLFRPLVNKTSLLRIPILSGYSLRSDTRYISTQQLNSETDYSFEYGKPRGELLDAKICTRTIVGKSASVLRTFTPKSNAQAFLICGGPLLAAHASFDPSYDRARTYIATRPVGNAVLSPVLINGLIGALVEASFPESFLMDERMKQFIPLIVGVSTSCLFSCHASFLAY